MDFDSIKDAMKFLNWEMVSAIGLMTLAWVQWLKKYLPAVYYKIPIIDLVAFASGFVFAHLIFDISTVKHTETVALFHGFCGSLFAMLGYELFSGKLLNLRSSSEITKTPAK